MRNFRIRKNDVVVVTAGKDKGKEGRVLDVLRKNDKVLVEGVNVVIRHSQPNPHLQQPGGRVEKEMPIHISNISLRCPECTEVTRTGYRFEESKDGERTHKVRFCKKCDKTIPQGGK